MIRSGLTAAWDSLRDATLGLVCVAAICGFGMLCVAGAKAAMRYHNRIDQPRLTHVSCRWYDGQVVVSGVVENPNDDRHRVFVVPRYRLDDGMVRALYVNVVNAELEGHSSKAWRFVGSPLAHQQIRFCAPFAWIDDED